ncbi:MAG: DUF1016 N-terminal domain-containing protein [Candidatus Omnitrophota bacterium]|jgi:endonuclease YncB( thermonuclease family)
MLKIWRTAAIKFAASSFLFDPLLLKTRTAMISNFIFKMRIMTIPVLLFFQVASSAFAAPAKVGTYNELVHAIREARAESQERVEQAIAQEKVREAWETGKLIDEHILLHEERAEYGKQVLLKLAKDLGVSDTELGYMLQFARAYPISRPAGKLSWSHYETLLAVNDPKERNALTERAEKENWNRVRLRKEIRNITRGGEAASAEVLTAQPGTPGTYRVLKATVGEHKGGLVLDLGFSCYYRPVGLAAGASVAEGDIVVSIQDTKGNDSLQIVPSPHPLPGGEDKGEGALNAIHPPPTDFLYTYKVDVVEVIDGDTLKASIPLGFGFTTVQKLRLRGLDAPEIESAEGKEAKGFLEKQFAKSKTPVLIRTRKSDKYDRYLVDVWIANRYLNQELIDEGLAVRVQS